jgi:PHD/YefM family antitoxin component YafN of YafNO toxin-antitoxin module
MEVILMPKILPISQLTSNPDYISKLCHGQEDAIFLTKDGYGDMVVMSMERYEALKAQADAFLVLMTHKAQAEKVEETAESQKTQDEHNPLNGIEKLPMEDVADIMKEELQRRRTADSFNKKRLPY